MSPSLDLLVVHFLDVVDGFAWLLLRLGAFCLVVSIDEEVVVWCLIACHYCGEALPVPQCFLLGTCIQGVQLRVSVEQG